MSRFWGWRAQVRDTAGGLLVSGGVERPEDEVCVAVLGVAGAGSRHGGGGCRALSRLCAWRAQDRDTPGLRSVGFGVGQEVEVADSQDSNRRA